LLCCSSPSPSLCSSRRYSIAARRLEPPLCRAAHGAELEHATVRATFTPHRLVELNRTTPPLPLRSSAPGTDELLIQAGYYRPCVPRITVEQMLLSPGRIDGRRAPYELPATAFHCREDVTGDSRVWPRNRCPSTTPSSIVAPQYSTTPPTPPDDPLTIVTPHQGAPPWTDLPVSPRPPPTPQIGPPLRRGAPRPVSPPPRAASDRNR
jgi:hypothetical protein